MAIALNAVSQFLDDFGRPLSGGKVWTYAAGTLTPLASYTSQDGDVPNTNPVVLDAAGRAQIWLTPNVPYKIRVTDASDVELEVTDEFYAGMNPEQLDIAGQVPASGGEFTGSVNFAGGATFGGTAAQDLATIDSLGLAAAETHNLWINPDLGINQRAVSSAGDAIYAWDRTLALCESGSVTSSSFDTAGLAMGATAGRIIQPDASAKRIGICQIVEARDVLSYRGKSLVLAAQARATSGITLRMALVAWTGTQDAPTRDVINTWSSTNYTASNFFIASTVTIATAAAALSAGVWTDVLVSSASPGGVVAPTTMKNLYMVFWTEGAAAQNLNLDFTAVRCSEGTEAPRWTPPQAQAELSKCMRTYEQGTWSSSRYGSAGGSIIDRVNFSVHKRVTPTLALAGLSESNASGTTVGSAGTGSFNYVYTVTALGMASSSATWSCTADF